MTNMKDEILKKIAITPKGEMRACLLRDENIRNLVLSSGANVTIYKGEVKKNAKDVIDEISEIYVGLILRKNKNRKYDGLGALGGLAERTSKKEFDRMTNEERKEYIGKKDDVIIKDGEVVLVNDIDVIRKNNVFREMSEELEDLGITDIRIDKDKLELINMPNIKDDNYMINIWDGKGECFAITPYCHIYKDDDEIIDNIVMKGKEKKGGEVACFIKMPLIEALKGFGNKKNAEHLLEDGRDAKKDYRYPHEYLALWGLVSKLLKDDDKVVELGLHLQENTNHLISFREIIKHTKQSMEDVAKGINIDIEKLIILEDGMKKIFYKNNDALLDKLKYCKGKDR